MSAVFDSYAHIFANLFAKSTAWTWNGQGRRPRPEPPPFQCRWHADRATRHRKRDAGDIAVRIKPDAATSIPDANAVADPDEIVVTAKSKKKPRYSISLGTEYLKNCSSITYDLRAKTVALSCAAVSAS